MEILEPCTHTLCKHFRVYLQVQERPCSSPNIVVQTRHKLERRTIEVHLRDMCYNLPGPNRTLPLLVYGEIVENIIVNHLILQEPRKHRLRRGCQGPQKIHRLREVGGL